MEYSTTDIENAFKSGNEKVFEVIFRSHYNSLCRYAKGVLNDPDEAEEIVQEVFATLWTKRTSIEIKVSIKAYLYRAVHNRCLNFLDKSKIRKMHAAEISAAPESISASAAGKLQQSELSTLIKKAIEKLPEQCRNVFKLSRYEEMKYTEIAHHLGISVKTVENQMGKALRIMRSELKDYLPQMILLSTILKFITR